LLVEADPLLDVSLVLEEALTLVVALEEALFLDVPKKEQEVRATRLRVNNE
jgi:hypothetical protein